MPMVIHCQTLMTDDLDMESDDDSPIANTFNNPGVGLYGALNKGVNQGLNNGQVNELDEEVHHARPSGGL